MQVVKWGVYTYGQTIHPRAFTKGQLVLRAAEHVRKNVPGPSKFAPNWEGPYIVREAHTIVDITPLQRKMGLP